MLNACLPHPACRSCQPALNPLLCHMEGLPTGGEGSHRAEEAEAGLAACLSPAVLPEA